MKNSFVVFDTEFTSWKGSQERGWSHDNEHREIVQIGAIGLDESLNIKNAFNLFIRPTKNPILSQYFKTLTGIPQSLIDEKGLSFQDAIDRTLTFIEKHQSIAYHNGGDDKVIEENLAINNMDLKLDKFDFYNIQPWLKLGLPRSKGFISSGKVLSLLAAEDKSLRKHNAIHDAVSIAKAIRILRYSEQMRKLPHE